MKGRLVDRNPRDRIRLVRAGDGVADLEVAQPLDRAEIAHRNEFGGHSPEILEPVDLLGPGRTMFVLVADHHRLAGRQRAGEDPPHRDSTRIGRIVQACDQHLQRQIGGSFRGRKMFHDRLEQRLHVTLVDPLLQTRPSIPTGCVHDGKVQSLVAGTEGDEEIEHLVEHTVGPGIGPIALVDDDDDRMIQFERLLSTKRVCGMGPSKASTSSRTPSAIFSTRSTSPPKSAWPGVSMMLMRQVRFLEDPERGRQVTAQFLEVMVMPRSFSRGSESRTQSASSRLSSIEPQ